jgi:hypothetical protein
MSDRDILKQIAFRLTGVELDDLTDAEKQIAKILIKHGLIIVREDGELADTE